jgi:hypothetical protein
MSVVDRAETVDRAIASAPASVVLIAGKVTKMPSSLAIACCRSTTARWRRPR